MIAEHALIRFPAALVALDVGQVAGVEELQHSGRCAQLGSFFSDVRTHHNFGSGAIAQHASLLRCDVRSIGQFMTALVPTCITVCQVVGLAS